MKKSKKTPSRVAALKLPAGLKPLKGKANAALEEAFNDREIGVNGGTHSVRFEPRRHVVAGR